MKILHLMWGRLDAFGGIETQIELLRTCSGAAGWDLLIRRLPSINHYHISSTDKAARLPICNFREALTSLILNERVEIIHSHNIHRPHAPGLAAAIAEIAKAARVCHVTTVHDVGSITPSLEERRRVSTILNDTVCIVTSRFNESLLVNAYGIDGAVIIPPGINFANFITSCEPEPRTICYPGRLTPGKGALQAIALLGMLSDELGPLTLLMSDRSVASYGESQEFFATLDTLIAKCPNLQCDFLCGPNVVPQIYSRACLSMALPIGIEGFGLTPLESIACGRPVVVTPTGGMTWLDNISGVILVKDRDITAIADAVTSVLNNWTSWHLAANRGREELIKSYGAERLVLQHMELYEEVCKDPQRPRREQYK